MQILSYAHYTALYNNETEAGRGMTVRLSMSQIYTPPGTRPGTHLIAISSADCGEILKEKNDIDLSSSFILNYYRQFLLKLRNVKTNFQLTKCYFATCSSSL